MRDNLISHTRKYFTAVQKLLYRIFACSYSLLVTFETLLYMLRTGRPWTIGIFTDLFFSTGAFQQNTQNLLSLITEEKQFCQFWEQTQETFLQQRRRTACGTAARDFSKHQQQLWLLGLPQPLLKACTRLPACGSEPHKMRFQVCLGCTEKLTHSFSTEEKKDCVFQSLLKERIMWREESSSHMCRHALNPCSAVLHWVQTAETTFTAVV